jgi:putative ABC transport system permease protein
MSIPDFADWQNQNQVFEDMAAFITGGVVFNKNDEAERVRGGGVSADLFRLMRTPPLLGRALLADDAQPEGSGRGNWLWTMAASLWRRPCRCGGKVTISGKLTTIVRSDAAGI